MLIVEGPDGGGKTTLIEELKAVFNMPVAPRVVTKGAEAMVDLVDWTEQNVAEGFQHRIYDRHRLISEPIYGPLLRKELEPGFADIEWFHRMIYSLYHDVKPIIVYCVPKLVTVQNNIRGDEDNTVVANDIQKIWSLYMTKATTDVATYDRAFYYDYLEPHSKSRLMVNILNVLKETNHASLRGIPL